MRRVCLLLLVAVGLSSCGHEDPVAARAVAMPVAPADAVPAAPTPTDPPPTTTRVPSTTSAPADPCRGQRDRLDEADQTIPDDFDNRLEFVLASPLWGEVDRSISVWIDGYGEVVADGADQQLLPASNQKIFTALGAALELDPNERFTTTVHLEDRDLVLVAGGDPTLTTVGAHSLDGLARQVAASGITEVDRLVVDASRFESATSAPGWLDWQMPAYVGPMSAFMVDDNRHRDDNAYLADPALGNGELFAELLAGAGVAVRGPVELGDAGTGAEIARLESATVTELVQTMMTDSDNEVAEALLRRIGDGSTTRGAARVERRLEEWCLDLVGESGDGSGLGRANWRSAREWRRLLQLADEQPWAEAFRASLAVAGRSGTLEQRFVGSPAEGSVRAKTGSILGGRSLSGFAVTAGGREVVFSIVVNGDTDQARVARDAIDGLVNALVAPLTPA